ADGDHKDGDEGEAWRSKQSADTDPQILQKKIEVIPTPGVASLFAQQHRIAEGASGCVASFVVAHAGGDVFSDLLFEMEGKLSIEAVGFALSMKKHLGPHPKFFQPAHHFPPKAPRGLLPA